MLIYLIELGLILAILMFVLMIRSSKNPAVLLLYFSFTLFVSATLLFMVQPMIGKMILPQLGGTPAVWNTCMVFFQGVLLVGYGYTHILTTTQPTMRQVVIQCVMLIFPFAVLPFALGAWDADPEANPTIPLMGKLLLLVGLPFFAVSTTAPLLQKWFFHTGHPAARDPYFLYGASNLGSMLGLGLYPTVIEPWLHLSPGDDATVLSQVQLWAMGFAIFVGLVLGCALFVWKGLSGQSALSPAPPAPPAAPAPVASPVAAATAISSGLPRKRGARIETPTAPRAVTPAAAPISDVLVPNDNITLWRRLRWIGLAAAPSSLMLGVTTYMTTDIAAVAFFWIVPLALYLLTFIIVFARWPVVWTGTPHVIVLFAQPMALLFLVLKITANLSPPTWGEFALHVGSFFAITLMCHGELARDRPSPKHLTEFFFWMSLGGVLGGLFNAFFAPVFFQHGIWEYPVAMAFACVLRANLVDTPKPVIPGDSTADRPTPLGYVLDWTVPILIGLLAYGFVYSAEHYSGQPTVSRYVLLGVVAIGALGSLAACFVSYPDQKNALSKLLGYDFDKSFGENVSEFYLLLRLVIVIAAGFAAFYFYRSAEPFDVLKRSYLLAALVVVVLALSLRPVRFGLAVAALFIGVGVFDRMNDSLLYEGRGFFGLLRVRESEGTWYGMPGKNVGEQGSKEWKVYRTLIHGGINHGRQIADFKEFDGTEDGVRTMELVLRKRREPITYFHERNGVAEVYMKASWPDARLPVSMIGMGAGATPFCDVLVNAQSEPPYAVLGLGTGILACYAKPFQTVDFYEIDPLVRNLSIPPDKSKDPVFWFVRDAEKRGADIHVIMGDGRLRLKEAPANFYHIISLDAFSSDAIPVHLLTAEAIELYMSKLADGGVLLFNTTNRYVRIEGVLAAIAKAKGYDCLHCPDYTYDTDHPDRYSADWVVLQRKTDKNSYRNGGPPIHERLEQSRKRTNWYGRPVYNNKEEQYEDQRWQEIPPMPGPIWTDGYSNLLKTMRWR